jgi:hypothetical protein
LYKSCASQSGLKGVEVVAEIALLPGGEITIHETGVMIEETMVGPIVVELLTQEEWEGVTHRVSLASELAKTNSKAVNLAVVTDEFDTDTFVENIDTEQHVEKRDEQQSVRAMKKTCNLQLTQLPMHQSAQLTKVMRQICPPQQLLRAMSRHLVVLTGVHIT